MCGPALGQTSLATYVKLFAQLVIRYCAALDNSSGEKETGFPSRKCTASLWWGHFYKAWKARCRRGGTTRAEKFGRAAPARAPGPRALLDPTWPTAASRPVATRTLSTWVPVSSLPGHLRPQPHLGPGHLGPRRPRALPVHLRAGRLRRGGREARGRGAALALRMRVQAGP